MSEELEELSRVLYSIPPKKRRVVADAICEYLVARGVASQLELLLPTDADGHDMLQGDSATGSEIIKTAGSIHPNNKLNSLTGNEWAFFTKTVLQTSYPSELGHKLRKQHYANKPPALMAHLIRFFTRETETVLDPFAGVGGTLLGATLCGRKAVGIELEQRWLDIYHKVCDVERLEQQEVICGDCLEVMPQLLKAGRQFEAIITDPPYSPALKKTMADGKYGRANRRSLFESFSSSPLDFRNAESFEDFYDRMQKAGELFYGLLKPERYAVVMIRDSFQNGEYIPASFHVAERFRKVGFQFRGIKLWYQAGAPVRPYGYPFAYVPNIVHHTILIFRKPNA